MNSVNIFSMISPLLKIYFLRIITINLAITFLILISSIYQKRTSSIAPIKIPNKVHQELFFILFRSWNAYHHDKIISYELELVGRNRETLYAEINRNPFYHDHLLMKGKRHTLAICIPIWLPASVVQAIQYNYGSKWSNINKNTAWNKISGINFKLLLWHVFVAHFYEYFLLAPHHPLR